jgi:hypothetical protein
MAEGVSVFSVQVSGQKVGKIILGNITQAKKKRSRKKVILPRMILPTIPPPRP